MNLKIILSNLAEAREQLQKLEALAEAGTLDETKLQHGLLHAYHHLNFAWNIRRVTTRAYAKLTQDQFEQWGRYPSDIERV